MTSLDARKVGIADVAPVFAQVHGDTVAARPRDDFGSARRIWMVAAACVADGRDVVDVDS